MKRLIVFLIRLRLGLKRNECFKFYNQRSLYDYYFFTRDELIKMEYHNDRIGCGWQSEKSHCSLNWLLNDGCRIFKIDEDTLVEYCRNEVTK